MPAGMPSGFNHPGHRPVREPAKAARKQAALGLELIRQADRAVGNGQPADQWLAQTYRQHREWGARDRRFFSRLVFAWFRWRGWLSAPDAAGGVATYLLEADEIHPAVTALAEQAGGQVKAWQPLATFSLAEKAGWLSRWLGTTPTLEQLAPEWLAPLLYLPAGVRREAHVGRCLEAFQCRPPTWLRIRTANRETVLTRLRNQGLAALAHDRIASAVRLPPGPAFDDTAGATDLVIQDLASQCIGLVCAPNPGESWWDVCAGAGGKSLHLADRLGAQGNVLATDVRDSILDECRRRLRRYAVRQIAVQTWDGAQAPQPDRLFDGVLVDAPCSGIGTWHRNPDARWRTRPEMIPAYVATQQNLLRIAADKVRPGGRLVYATCTLTAAENTDVIRSFLATRPDFALAPVPHPLTGEPTDGQIWIWPWQGPCNGMFIASLKRA